MSITDKRIDAYIDKSEDFAKPILKHLRKLVHTACPDVEETIKWGFPHFDYHGILCSMASFKKHCAFSFWKASLMKNKKLVANAQSESAMGHFGRIASLSDLPSDKILISYIKEAVQLNIDGVVLVKKKPTTIKKELFIPGYFLRALKKNSAALKTFQGFSYSNKKEYVEWVTEAKTEETRDKRLIASIEWMAEGKVRNWKYVRT